MTNSDFFLQLKSDPMMKFYSRVTINAIVSNVELAFDRFIDSISDIDRFGKVQRLIKSAVKNWERIKLTFDDVVFPKNFIACAIHAYSGRKSEFFLRRLDLDFDKELSGMLREWLPENYRRGCPVTDPRLTKPTKKED